MKQAYRYWWMDVIPWLRHRSSLWITWKHSASPDGKGDLIWWMALYALITGDARTIRECIRLLNEEKRWPDSMNQEIDAKNRVQYFFSKLSHKIGLIDSHLFRSQNSVTRDPYIMLICAIYWHQYEMIQDLKVPWLINRAPLYWWKKYLENPTRFNKEKYEDSAIRNIDWSMAFGYHAYVKHLNAWMAWIAKSEKVQEKIKPLVPEWNGLLKLLCGEHTLTQEDIDNFKPMKGYIWNASTFDYLPDRLEPGEIIYMDKAILQFVFDEQGY